MKHVEKLKGEPELGVIARVHIDVVLGPDDSEPFLNIKNHDKLPILQVIEVLAAAIQSMVQVVGTVADPEGPNFGG